MSRLDLWVIALGVFVLSLALEYVWLRRTRATTTAIFADSGPQTIYHTRTEHVNRTLRHTPFHAIVPLLLIVASFVLIGVAVLHGLGARAWPVNKVIVPPAAIVRAGARAPTCLDYSRYEGPPLDQGGTNACGSFSLMHLAYAEMRSMGQVPQTYFSPWYHRYCTVGSADGYTSFDQNIAALNQCGLVYHWLQEGQGQPSLAAYAAAVAPSAWSYHVVAARAPGAQMWEALRGTLSTYHVAWLLIDDRGLDNLTPQNPITALTGTYEGSHFIVVDGVCGNLAHAENSWGSGWGQRGDFYITRAGVESGVQVIAAVTSPAGIFVAPPPPPTATARPRPTATRRPQRRPTATAVPRHTPRPHRPPTGLYVTLTRAQWERRTPRAASARVCLVRKGARVKRARGLTPHWIKVQPCGGWVLRSHTR